MFIRLDKTPEHDGRTDVSASGRTILLVSGEVKRPTAASENLTYNQP